MKEEFIFGIEQRLFYNMAGAKNVTGRTLLLSLSEVAQHLFEANIKREVALYELKMKLKCKMSHFEGKVVNHGSREMLVGRVNIIDGAKFPSQLLASVISLTLQSKFLIKKH